MLESNIIDKFLNFLFEEECLGCGAKGAAFCTACLASIPHTLTFNNNVLSFYSFRNDLISKILWQFKYHHTHKPVNILVKEISKRFYKESHTRLGIAPNSKIAFVPVPLNIDDKRLHNHALVFTKMLSKNLKSEFPNISILDILSKNTKLKQSHTENRVDRFENIKGSIYLRRNFQRNTLNEFDFIFIIDDVTTTGATIDEIKKVLLKNFSIQDSKIFGLTIAH